MANCWNKNESPRWRGTARPTVHTSAPGQSHLLSLPPVFLFLHMDPSEAMEGKHGSKRKEKHSEGINGSERRMTSVMEIRVDRRSNTGGSLLSILLNRNASPTLGPVSSESWTHANGPSHTYTHAAPPTRAHNACHANELPLMQTHHCVPIHAAGGRRPGGAELLRPQERGYFEGNTDDYGGTRCDSRLLQVSRGVKQAGRAPTSLLLALRLQLHGWCPQGQGS